MPTYEYRCAKCGDFEVTQRITEDALTVCPHCEGKNIQRLVSMSSFQLKGSGWYKTDYASSGSSSNTSKSSRGSKDGSSSSLDSKVKKTTESSNSSSSSSSSSSNNITNSSKRAAA